MKRTFRIIGWILFAMICYLLLFEYSDIKMFDTNLFFLNGESMGFQWEHVFNLSPTLMAIIFFLVFALNIGSIFFKKDYLIVNIGNFILSIPIFLVLSSHMIQYPPFNLPEDFVTNKMLFISFAYLSIISLIALIICLLLKKFRSNNK